VLFLIQLGVFRKCKQAGVVGSFLRRTNIEEKERPVLGNGSPNTASITTTFFFIFQ
jgi:hypothetical protein